MQVMTCKNGVSNVTTLMGSNLRNCDGIDGWLIMKNVSQGKTYPYMLV
jgi:hypothetical protein